MKLLEGKKTFEFSEPIVKVVTTNWYRLLEDYDYFWEQEEKMIRFRIYAGFEFDGASIPLLAQAIVPKWSLGKGPPAVHDALYRCGGDLTKALFGIHKKETDHGLEGVYASHSFLHKDRWLPVGGVWTRTAADRLFGRHMREAGVRRSRRRMAYRAVRLAGRGSWRG